MKACLAPDSVILISSRGTLGGGVFGNLPLPPSEMVSKGKATLDMLNPPSPSCIAKSYAPPWTNFCLHPPPWFDVSELPNIFSLKRCKHRTAG